MNDSKIAVRYAKALYSLAVEKNALPALHADVEMLYLTTRTLPEFVRMLESPVIKASEKRALVKNVFEKQVNPLTLSFLNLLLTNKREMYLESIARDFLALYRKNSGMKSALLSSAVALDTETVAQMTKAIAARFKAQIELTTEVDPALIGGFVLQVDDQMIDASVSSRLKQLRQELVKSK
jgi:ATP synthase, F1 delta subunit